MSAPPLVSVVMPCFNAGAMLRPALASVLGQTWANLEVIFVDNNSTDGSLDTARQMAAEAARPVQVLTCPEQGVNHARNLGYGHAKGEFIQWMDADDELAPDKIALQVAALQADPSADIAYCDWVESRVERGAPKTARHRLAQDDDQIARTLAGLWYPPHAYLLRRPAADRLQAAQAWKPGRPVATDVEYSAIAALLGLRFRHTPEALVRYNVWSEAQISGRTNYALRLASLAAIYERLRALAAEAGTALSPRHRALLDQDWGVWRMAPGSVTLTKGGGRQVELRHTASGKTLDLRPREAAIVRALLTAPGGQATPHLTLRLAALVPEAKGDHAAVAETLARLQREGFMERMALPA